MMGPDMFPSGGPILRILLFFAALAALIGGGIGWLIWG